MQRAVAFINFGLGVVALGSAVMSMVMLPGAMQRFSVEPENLYSLLLLSVLAMAVGLTSLLDGRILLRGGAVGWWTARRALVLSVLVAVPLAAAALLGFTDEQPTSYELRFLVAPVIVLAITAGSLWRIATASSG